MKKRTKETKQYLAFYTKNRNLKTKRREKSNEWTNRRITMQLILEKEKHTTLLRIVEDHYSKKTEKSKRKERLWHDIRNKTNLIKKKR